MAAIGLRFYRVLGHQKSSNDDQAEWARTTDEAAWSAA